MADTKKTKPALGPSAKVKSKTAEMAASADISSSESSDKITTTPRKGSDLSKTSMSEMGLETMVERGANKLSLLKIFKVDKADGKLAVGDVIYAKKAQKATDGSDYSRQARKESSGDSDLQSRGQIQQQQQQQQQQQPPLQLQIQYYRDPYTGAMRAMQVPVAAAAGAAAANTQSYRYPGTYVAYQSQAPRYAQYPQYAQNQQPMSAYYYQYPAVSRGVAYNTGNYRYY